MACENFSSTQLTSLTSEEIETQSPITNFKTGLVPFLPYTTLPC